MAIFKSLTFDGINSLNYGIYITGEAVYNAPERVVEMVSVPGRNGDIAIDQGRFENIEVTYHAGCFADSQADFADKVMRFRNALASRYTYKRLTDEYHPDEYRLGLYKSGLEVDAVHYSTAGEFDITFDCKPQRFLTSGETALTPSDYIDTQTATGEIVTIDSDGSLGVKALKVALDPIQDLNGYDHPWVGGAGVNVFPYLNTREATFSGVTFKSDGKGTLQMTGTATGDNYASLTFSEPFVIPDGTTYKFCMLNTESRQDSVFKFMNESTIVDSWSPNPVNREATYSGMSGKTVTGIRLYCKNGETYNLTMRPMLVPKTETVTGYIPYSNICPISGRTSVDTVVSPTTSASDGTTYTTDLGRTVYGGTLDVVSGELVMDRAMVDLGTLNWRYDSGGYFQAVFSDDAKHYTSSETANAICSSYAVTSVLDATSRNGYFGIYYYASGGKNYIRVHDEAYTDATAFASAMSGVQLCYELASPQTVQLSGKEISLLLGTNHLWSDGGEITVTYGVHPYYNPTPFDAKPLIKVTGRGTLGIGEYILTITGTESQTLYIDCDSQEAWEVVGAGRISRNDYIQNAGEEFPVLVPGINNISVGSGITAVTITPRWWRI